MTVESDLLASITTREQLLQVVKKHHLGLPSVRDLLPQLNAAMVSIVGSNVLAYTDETVWPFQRDYLREEVGAYQPPTSVLQWMRTHKTVMQHFPHISSEDPTMVAFTADMEGAVKDKKVRTTLGRFIRKFFPLLTDDAVRNMESSHRAELDPTLEVVTGFEAVCAAYTGMQGDSGCMRYGKDHFGHEKYHPSAIYASPGFGVAVHRNGSGVVKSRAVVWVNPADANDKRYVRIYGDPALQKKLERNGYKLRGLKGAKILALQDDAWAGDQDYKDRFVMPYIDPAGGIHYGGTKDVSFDARHVVRYDDDPDYLHLITPQERDNLTRLGVQSADTSSQSGSVVVPLSSRSDIMVTCAITGQKFSRLEVRAERWMYANGSLGYVKQSAIGPEHSSRMLGTPAQIVRVYGTVASFEGKCLTGGYADYIDNEHTMRHMHLCRLDPAHYPGEGVYDRNDCVAVGESFIKNEDAYQVQEFGDDGTYTMRFVHKDSIKLLRKMGYVSMQAINGMKLVVHESDKRIVETAGGRKALQGLHAIHQLWDGRWDFARNIEQTTIGAFTINVRKNEPADGRNAVVSDTQMELRIFSQGDALVNTLTDARVRRSFLRYFGRFLHKPADAVVDASYNTASVTPESIIAAGRAILEMTPEQVDALHYSRMTTAWAKSVVRCAELSEENKVKAYELAEACALEYEVPQGYEDFDPDMRSEEDRLLSLLDAALAAPSPTFIRSTANMTTAGRSILDVTNATAATSGIRFLNQV